MLEKSMLHSFGTNDYVLSQQRYALLSSHDVEAADIHTSLMNPHWNLIEYVTPS